MTWDKETLAGAEAKGRLVAFQGPCLQAHLPQAQGFTGVNSPTLNGMYWLEEKPDRNMLGKKARAAFAALPAQQNNKSDSRSSRQE